ncbi:MAG: Smr/MutS family protein [Clostridiales bacterium]|nr:Smr/MutS family protein [Clostridiales bacterium]
MEKGVKVKEINLERGNPTVEVALRNLVNELSTAKRVGYRALVLVHGYGSSGTGGAIKAAVKAKLGERSLSGIIRSYAGGEEWFSRKREFTESCSQLKDYSPYIDGNRGVTVVLLK